MPKTKRQKSLAEKRSQTAAGVARFRARQKDPILALGYTSEQNMVTCILKKQITPELQAYLKEVLK